MTRILVFLSVIGLAACDHVPTSPTVTPVTSIAPRQNDCGEYYDCTDYKALAPVVRDLLGAPDPYLQCLLSFGRVPPPHLKEVCRARFPIE